MATEPRPATPRKPVGTRWRGDPVPAERRPWALAALTLGAIALAIAGSVGPWLTIGEGAPWDMAYRTVPGLRTDGVFALGFAGIAAAIVLLTLAWPDRWVLAWGAVVAMVLCSLVSLFDWVLFDPMDLAYQPGLRAELVRVEWGLKLLTVAAPVGAALTILYARRLTHGDY